MHLAILSSCVNDDSFFPDETSDQITPTVAMVTLLNDINDKGDFVVENQLCFSFVYPIVLGYNTDSSIRINSFSGLLDAIAGQSPNFNIVGVQFPIEIKFTESETTIKIENEDALFEVLRECELTTFRDQFNALFRQCYKFEYPLTLFDNNRSENIIENDEALGRFLNDQGINYQPDFKFPITVLVAPVFEPTSVSSYFQFYNIINNCVGCPDTKFTSEIIETPAIYRFKSEVQRDDALFFWFINDELVGNASSNTFEYDFFAILDGSLPGGPGTYKICLMIETPDCQLGKKECIEIFVAPECPELRFEFEREPDTFSYSFVANFPGITETSYNWIVDDQIVEDNDGGTSGDNMFSFQFTPGVHEVCINTETLLCPQGIEFCQEIAVCPEPFFIAERQGNTTVYDFTADFLGMQDVTYEWIVNGEPQESDGGAGGDNMFTFQFDPGTSNEVCVVAEVQGCTSTNTFCVPIDVP
ncbi:hypothetical protein GCM10022258_38470 [Aquimarina gracilis]